MPHGITQIDYSAKTRTQTRFGYDATRQLAAMHLGGFDGGLELTQYLRADQLQAVIDSATLALLKMLDDPGAIGQDTLAKSTAAGIHRLEHLANWRRK